MIAEVFRGLTRDDADIVRGPRDVYTGAWRTVEVL